MLDGTTRRKVNILTTHGRIFDDLIIRIHMNLRILTEYR